MALALQFPGLTIELPVKQVSTGPHSLYVGKNVFHGVSPIDNDTVLAASELEKLPVATVDQHLFERPESHCARALIWRTLQRRHGAPTGRSMEPERNRLVRRFHDLWILHLRMIK